MNIKQIGFKGYDDPPKIMEFIKQNVDYEKLFTSIFSREKRLECFTNVIQWDILLSTK